jgi:SAM-dependent methyltransferase
MLEAAALQRGDRVLELAAGPGTLSVEAARAVGADGLVICSDFSEAMVDAARRRVAAAGVGSVELRTLDAESLDLPDERVDVVLCRCGYMLMADPAAAMRETARVLVPGGRVAFAVWADAGANPWAALPMRVAAECTGAPPPAGAPGLWALADAARLRALLADAGFGSIRIEPVDATVRYASVADWIDRTSRLAAPLRALLDAADASARAAVDRELEAAAAPYEQPDGGILLPQRFLLAAGRR